MNFFEKMKYIKTEEYEDYKKARDLNKMEAHKYKEYFINAKLKLNEQIKNDSRNLTEIYRLKNEMLKWNYEYEKRMLIAEFIRPNNKEEIESRKIIANTFAQELKNILGDNSNLRFHGTPIYYACEIIKSNSITSTADRHHGYSTSSDYPGIISASTINSLNRTIDYFTNFSSYQRCLPCGVVFVLREKPNDIDLRNRSEMHNVNFKTHPEQLVAILCSDEVKALITKLCMKYNMDENKVFTYNEFLEYAKNNNLENSKTK